MPENNAPLPDFTRWPSFPFEGGMRVKKLAAPVDVEPPRSGEDAADCVACNTPDDAYIWVSERWRVRAMDRPTGLPMVLILECRSHLDLGDLPNLLAAELGVMTVRLERAIRTLDEVARVHVNRWGDGSAHLHMWFLARPYGRLQLRGTFLSLWDDILPVIPEYQWRGNLALVAAWLAEFGGHANAEPPHIQWQSPGTISESPTAFSTDDRAISSTVDNAGAADESAAGPWRPADLADIEGSTPDSGSVGAAFAGAPVDGLAGEAARPQALQASRTTAGSAVGDSSREGTNVRLGGADVSAEAGGSSAQAPAERDYTPGAGASGAAPTGEVASGTEPTSDHHAGGKAANGDTLGPDVIGDAIRGGGSSRAGEAVGGEPTSDDAEERDAARRDGDAGDASASAGTGGASSTTLPSRQPGAGATARP